MNIEAAVKYLEYTKQKMKLLSILLLLPNFLYKWIETMLSKEIFKENHLYFRMTFFFIYTIVTTFFYIILFLFLPRVLTQDFIYLYTIVVCLLTLLISFYQIKMDYFEYFTHDHFFNMLGKHQSVYIKKRVQYQNHKVIYHILLPMLMPLFYHVLLVTQDFLYVLILISLIIFIYQFISIITIIILYIAVLVKKFVILKVIFLIYKYLITSIILIGFLGVIGYGILVYQNGTQFEIDHANRFFFIIFGVLVILNGLFYLLRDIPFQIIDNSYKKIIYAEGNNWKKDIQFKNDFLSKVISIGAYSLNKIEKAIYQKEIKHLLRLNHGKLYVILIGIPMILLLTIFSFGTIDTSEETLNKFQALLTGQYMFLNFFMAIALGYFNKLHKHVTSFSNEGINHYIFNQSQVNFFEIFRGKYYFNRFLVMIPFVPYFLITLFQIDSFNTGIIYLIGLIYFYGMTNLIIASIMIDDFIKPNFNHIFIDSNSNIISNYYSYYLVYVIFIFPTATSYLSKEVSIWIIISSILAMIYLLNFMVYRKIIKLKNAKEISYGGIKYVEDKSS